MSKKIKILVVEDDVKLSELIQDYLASQGFEILGETQGDKAVDRIINENPDLVILDLMLPVLDGLSVLRAVRNKYSGSILVLTAKEDDMDQVAGLETGADDYVKKPIIPRVLLARIRALLRRNNIVLVEQQEKSDPQNELRFGKLLIRKDSRRVTLDEAEIELTTGEFSLLLYLAERSGIIISRDQLYLEIRGYDYNGLDRLIDISISRLRKKMGDDTKSPFRIKTIWGTGYLFVPDAWS